MSRDTLIKGKVSLKNYFYHVTTCTGNMFPFFHNLQHGRLMVNEMKKLQCQKEVISIAWVIMADHLHWLFQLSPDNTLSNVIQ